MHYRAIMTGLVLALLIACFGWYLNHEVRLPVANTMIPLIVFGLLVLGLLTVNPLLHRLGLGGTGPAGWAVVVALMLVSAAVPGNALMQHFTPILALPHKHMVDNPAWRQADLLQYAPPGLLAEATLQGRADPRVVYGLLHGLGPEPVGIEQVPWHGWARPLAFWLPLLGLGFTATVALMVVVHRQWAHHERLRYPVAEFAASLLHGAGRRALPDIFHTRAFWAGLLPVAGVLLINGYADWNPDSLRVPLHVDFSPIADRWPELATAPGFSMLVREARLHFVVVGFAFLVSAEISFTLGISNYVYGIVFALLLAVGYNPRGGFDYLGGCPYGFQMFGSYLGMAVMLLYTGRRYFASVLLRCLAVPRGDPIEPGIVWAGRLALLAGLGMWALLSFGLNLSPVLAAGFLLAVGLGMVVMTRINAETGMFRFHYWGHGVAVLLGLFGAAAMGPEALIVLAVLSAVTTIDAQIALMPLVANGLRIGELGGTRPSRLAPWMALTLVLCLLAGVIVTIWIQYSVGVEPLYWSRAVSRMPWDLLHQNLPRMDTRQAAPGQLDWSAWAPDPHFLYAAGLGFVLVVLTSGLRLRFTWWPIHPVMFLVWGIWPLHVMGNSWLLGWLVKSLVTRIGGAKAFYAARPAFIGMIAGDFAARILLAGYSAGHYLVTGTHGP